MMDFASLNNRIVPADPAAMAAARTRWNSLAKPIGGLGLLEEAVVRLAGLIGSARVCLDRRRALVFCADNGVTAEGVAQTDASVTALVAGNMLRGQTTLCRMARVARAEVLAVDMGMNEPVAGLRDLHVARGTDNMTLGPAMSRAQALQAIAAGMDLARESREQGFHILTAGEMGIGNTTTAAAMAAVLCGMSAGQTVGRGAGLSDEGLERKRAAVEKAIAVNRPDPRDPLDVLAKLGGFDIAAMTGLFLGGALHRIPVIADGFISAVAALTAQRLCPNAAGALFASHQSAEPAAGAVLEALGLEAPIRAGLHLGEGTGALCLLPLLDMALAVYEGMSSFDDIGLRPYEEDPS